MTERRDNGSAATETSHAKLRAAFLEGTAGWLYWWLWRLDDQWEKFGPGCERQLSMLPSELLQAPMLEFSERQAAATTNSNTPCVPRADVGECVRVEATKRLFSRPRAGRPGTRCALSFSLAGPLAAPFDLQ
jgi:hypothetical protein